MASDSAVMFKGKNVVTKVQGQKNYLFIAGEGGRSDGDKGVALVQQVKTTEHSDITETIMIAFE